jgi:ubiquinol-cytochrome c reductase cytochrome b subunit
VIGGRTVIPEPFWGGAAFPLFVFATLYAWPALERRFSGDRQHHDLLDRPRDHPTRTAIGAGFFSWVFAIFAAGATDRVFYRLHISYVGMIHFWRAGIWALPIIVFVIVRSGARALQRSEDHPMRASPVSIVDRNPDGAPHAIAPKRNEPDGVQPELSDPAVHGDGAKIEKSPPVT